MNETIHPIIALEMYESRTAELRKAAAEYRLASASRRSRPRHRAHWWDRFTGGHGGVAARPAARRPAMP
ncbi:MAG TPA: hypothetical protein VFE14_02715 [Micromonosporaceae bacterium]|jgi:hypothetical protein|nr:hypothetical protein [Micromonosporaceae bacterium]